MTVEDCKQYLKDHPTFSTPLREKRVSFGYDPAKGFDATRERKFNAVTERARRAMEGGILPDNCTTEAVDRAYKMSEKTGMDYRSDTRPDYQKVLDEVGIKPMTKQQIMENAQS
jgi:hypothetical protein